MRNLAAFDLHLSPFTTAEQLAVVTAFQDSLTDTDRVIYGGDVKELTWFSYDEVSVCRAWQEFEKRLRPHDVLLYGNHDVDERPCWDESELVESTLIMHGHQFDKSAGGCAQRTYYRLAPWVRNVWLRSPMEQKMANDKSWQEHNGQVWGAAIRWLEGSIFTNLVIGHTHDTAVIMRLSGKVLFGIGSLPEDKVYFDLDSMSLKKVEV